jgi:hypothetical protein
VVAQACRPRGVRFCKPSLAAPAGVLLLATAAAFVWANLAADAYAVFWETPLTIRAGNVGLTLTLREWVNSGLMTFFLSWSGWRPGGSSIWASCDSDVGSRFRCWRAWGAWSCRS